MHEPVKLVNSKLKMLNVLIYLHIFAILMDQMSAVNKDFNQSVLTSSKMNHTLGKNQTHNYSVLTRSNMLC